MPKYLWKASYTTKGVSGVAKEGGTGRRDAVKNATESVGGTLEGFYFAFGEADAYVIADLPDNETAAAVALAVNGSDGAAVETVVLLTPEEVDAAAKKNVDFRPAGAESGSRQAKLPWPRRRIRIRQDDRRGNDRKHSTPTPPRGRLAAVFLEAPKRKGVVVDARRKAGISRETRYQHRCTSPNASTTHTP